MNRGRLGSFFGAVTLTCSIVLVVFGFFALFLILVPLPSVRGINLLEQILPLLVFAMLPFMFMTVAFAMIWMIATRRLTRYYYSVKEDG